MYFFMNRAFLAAAIILLTSLQVMADVRIDHAKLSSRKINLVKFGIIALSGDGKILTAFEKVSDPQTKQKGFSYKLWIIESNLENKGNIRFSYILLPIYQFDQMALSDDGRTALITANGGATFLEVNIPSRKVRLLFDHKRGNAGFRADASVTYFFDGRFYLWGYFYDGENTETKRGITLIDTSKNGIDMFKLVYDTSSFEESYGNARYIEWISPIGCVLFGRKNKSDKEMTLALYDNGTLKELDKGYTFTGLSGAAGRVLYCVEREKDKIYAIIRDISGDKSWILHKSPMPFSYTSLSRDGRTAIVTLMDIKKRTSTFYYAMEKDNYELKIINAVANSQFSTIRLAPFGRIYATFDGRDIYWGRLE